jgi:chitinase
MTDGCRASTRACDKRNPEDIDTTAFTHLMFAFAYFDPKSFKIAPMSAGDVELYRRFTALKSKQPGLQTWIAVGGWAFNDDTNVPNTRTAFSDMVSSAVNRQAFITGLAQFLQTHRFDGVDLDWEYPAADDRGGVEADTANFVKLLQELRSAFSGRYGISLTLPASYWYLQGFDVKSLQNYVDWMNVMSYDIHGVWDKGNVHTGPYVKPHTNWTEIEEGLDLLWRAGVQPSKINIGLGWYGRSFTLANPSCKNPDGICLFSQGGSPGECTKSAGTLTNAEINRIIAKGGVTKGFDKTAAVKWISWNNDQWVSYDDGESIQMKISRANSRCLGGKMVWAVDQDAGDGSSTNDLLGIGTSNGVDAAKAKKAKDQLIAAQKTAAVASSCYWTFCNKDCAVGYFPATTAKGQVQSIQADTNCPVDQAHTLCCAPGTTLGTCKWEGWRGVGLSCAPVCSDSSATIVARNTNSEDKDCNGGYQAYCCSGFKPSTKTNTAGLALIGQDELTQRSLEARNWLLGLTAGARWCSAVITLINLGLSVGTGGANFLGQPAEIAACIAVGAAVGFAISNLVFTQPNPTTPTTPTPRNTGVPAADGKMYGQWPKLDFGSSTSSCDCSVTYTCRYGLGWDEICNNQRFAIDKGLNGATVFHYLKRGRDGLYSKSDWRNQHKAYQKLAQQPDPPARVARCQVDEFPMGSLAEGRKPQPQICRLVNGPANMAQGRDFGAWLQAQWRPCSAYRMKVCGHPEEPPITWAFNPAVPRPTELNTGQHFVEYYGVGIA